MTDPITLTERDLWIASAGNLLWGIARMAPGAPLPAEVVESARIVSCGYDQHVKPIYGDQPERRRANAASASPPRAPVGITGPVLPYESGPGQPMPPYAPDIADALDGWAAQYSEPEDVRARCLREAAAEIRKLREQMKAERRAGIEAAAGWHDQQAAEWNEHYAEHGGDPSAREYAKQHRTDAAAIRALADKPAPFDFAAHLRRQRDWSERTFGPGTRAAGVVDHIRKELREIEADPADLKEWIDVVILALDGAWRSGAAPEQIVAALVAKQTRNEARQWPDWRTVPADKAIEHVRKGG